MTATRSSGNAHASPSQAPEAPDLYSRLEEAYDWVSSGISDLYSAATGPDLTPPRTSSRLRPEQSGSTADRRERRDGDRPERRAERPGAAAAASPTRGGLSDLFDTESVSGFFNQFTAGDCTASNFNPRCSHEASTQDAVESIRRNDSWERGAGEAVGLPSATHREAPFVRNAEAEELPDGPWDIPREKHRPKQPEPLGPLGGPQQLSGSPVSDGRLQVRTPDGRRRGASSASSPFDPPAPMGSPKPIPRNVSSPPQPLARRREYDADPEDPVDQHVAHFINFHPEVLDHGFYRKQPGLYAFDGRELRVEQSERGLVVLDGPLRQPMADYMACSEKNAEYDVQGIGVDTSLHSIPREKRMSFHDTHKVYSRLEAMKVAKEQALVRERAADYTKDGREVPRDLMSKYKKNLAQKLDPANHRRKEREPPALAVPPSAKAAAPQVPITTSLPYQWSTGISSGSLPGTYAAPPFSAPAAAPAWDPRYQLQAPNLFQPMTLSPSPSGFPAPSPPAVFHGR